MLGLRTLVLHPDYTPISLFPLDTIPVEEAIVRVIKNNATCVLSYDRKILTPSTDKLYWPSIIVNKQFYKRYNDARLKHETLFYRDHGICQYCEEPLTERTITCDHVMPQSKGGPHHWENVVAACRECNAAKDDNLPKGKWAPKRKPYTPSLHELMERRRSFPISVDDLEWVPFIGGHNGWRGEVSLRPQAREIIQEYGLV